MVRKIHQRVVDRVVALRNAGDGAAAPEISAVRDWPSTQARRPAVSALGNLAGPTDAPSAVRALVMGLAAALILGAPAIAQPVPSAGPAWPRAASVDVSSMTLFLDELIRDALIGRAAAAYEAARDLAREDDRRRAAGAPATGLADNALALAAAVNPSRDQRRAWQREALDAGADPYLRDILRRELREDPVVEFRRLGWHDAWNRAVAPVNAIIRAVVTAFEGQPQALVQIPVDVVFAIPRAFRLTERQRKRVTLADRVAADEELRRAAPPALAKKAAVLRQRMERERVDAEVRLARYLYEQDRLREAGETCRAVLQSHPAHAAASDLLARSEKRRSLLYRRQIGALTVLDGEPWPAQKGPPARDYEALLQGLIAPDVAAAPPPSESGLRAEAAYAASARFARTAPREEALASLRALAAGESATAIRARAWIQDDRFNLDRAMEQGRDRLAADRRRYILSGALTSEQNLYQSASAAAARSASGAANLGVLNVIGVATRWIQVALRPVVSAGPAMDPLVIALREDPNRADADALRLRYAQWLRYMQLYVPAAEQYRLAGALTPKRELSLRTRDARRAFRVIQDMPGAAERVRDGEQWLARWGDLKMAAKARKQLEKDRAEAAIDFRLDRHVLREERDRWLALGMPLKSEWLDGRSANGEIDKEGATIRQGSEGQIGRASCRERV